MDDWLKLFDIALHIIDRAQETMGGKISWTIGGGTMLHELFAHRYSHDIDIFVNDPQVLLYITPRTNDVADQVCHAGSNYIESSNFIKFVTPDGEIDFIVAPRLTTPHALERSIGSRQAMVETAAEILAKKLLYRAEQFTGRDIFDLAFLIENGEAAKLLAASNSYLPNLAMVMQRIETNETALRRSFDQIMPDRYTPTFDHCVKVIADFVEAQTRAAAKKQVSDESPVE
jgi:hypothetical protein